MHNPRFFIPLGFISWVWRPLLFLLMGCFGNVDVCHDVNDVCVLYIGSRYGCTYNESLRIQDWVEEYYFA